MYQGSALAAVQAQNQDRPLCEIRTGADECVKQRK